MMMAAYLFDPIRGTLILVTSKSIGVAIVFFFYNKLFIKNLISRHDLGGINKKKIIKLFKKNELYYLILFRLFPGVPVQVLDLFPLLIRVKFGNYILSKFIGSLLPHFLLISLFNEFYKNFDNGFSINLDFSITNELLIALLIFGIFIIVSNIIKKTLKIYKWIL